MSTPLYGAVEAGGTKFLLAVGEDPSHLREIHRVATSDHPQLTLDQVVDYFRRQGPLAAIGVASFGPVDFLRGAIGKSPKLAWAGFPIVEAIAKPLNTPVLLDTDVNGAALGEARFGAGAGLDSFLYLTVGTGIGGGAIVDGRPLHGLLHPEMGHLLVRRHVDEATGFTGVCPFHGDCLEGLASGSAMRARWGAGAETLADDHPAWALEAYYLAQACFSMACILSPQRIVIGGGVAGRTTLYPRIHRELAAICGQYLPLPAVVAPALEYPALTGALVMAREAV
jgi:fructokinase